MSPDPRFDILDFLPYLLTQSAEEASLGFRRVYQDRYGMLRTEWRALFHLGRYGAMTATEIRQRSGLHKTKISRAVKALETKRFLERSIMEQDKRNEELRLTRAGRAAYEDLLDTARSYDKRLAAQFSDEEQLILRRCLKRLAGV